MESIQKDSRDPKPHIKKPHCDYVTHPLLTQKANDCISSQISSTWLYTAGIVGKPQEQSSSMARQLMSFVRQAHS
jgi:hypothetical protein